MRNRCDNVWEKMREQDVITSSYVVTHLFSEKNGF